ncbi:MAG: pantoate--beta-alanine ligase [Acidobacteria bacterium]|nr:pantoate--beta-alanine ligase [Acidobacteriota bacterium]
MSNVLVNTIAEVRARVAAARRAGRSIGCVPTMGALHAGHGALMERARAECGTVVATIFVNPIQFDVQADYDRYARNLPADLAFCGERGVDMVFAPALEEMYPAPAGTFVDVPETAQYLCGQHRPGHFRGVATVVAKLLHIVQPDFAYFGEKDAQQLAVIERMVEDLNFPVSVVSVPTVREADGLALSSRNERLTAEQRRAAPALYRALQSARQAIADGVRNAETVKGAALPALAAEPLLRVEYFEVVDPRSFHPVAEVAGGVRIATAVWAGSTRLIDNVFCPAEESSARA